MNDPPSDGNENVIDIFVLSISETVVPLFTEHLEKKGYRVTLFTDGGPSESARADDTWVESAAAPASDGDRLRNLALFVPRLLQLIGRLVADPEVPLLDKVTLGAAAAYVASPLDILPDAVPLLGQLDDIYLITICLLRLLHRSGEAKLRQHWEGPEDIVQILHTVTDIATRYLPGGLRARLRGWVEAKPPA